jgi:hypothetical protein
MNFVHLKKGTYPKGQVKFPNVAEKMMGTYNYINYHPDFCPVFYINGPEWYGWKK